MFWNLRVSAFASCGWRLFEAYVGEGPNTRDGEAASTSDYNTSPLFISADKFKTVTVLQETVFLFSHSEHLIYPVFLNSAITG
jgi:hypothetical protein